MSDKLDDFLNNNSSENDEKENKSYNNKSEGCDNSDGLENTSSNDYIEGVSEKELLDAKELSRFYKSLDKRKSRNRGVLNSLGSRDLLLATLIANGVELDHAYLKAICFDDPESFYKTPLKLRNACKKYIKANPKLCEAICELKDQAIDQYIERHKINKNFILNELLKLKALAGENPMTYSVALQSLKLIGQELGMFETKKSFSSNYDDRFSELKETSITIEGTVKKMLEDSND